MPTLFEVLIDPLSITSFVLYGILILLEAIRPARRLPKVNGWIPTTMLVFGVYFFLSVYLPLFWDKYLVEYRILDLTGSNPWLSTIIALFIFELLIYIWHRTMHRTDWLWRTFHQFHHSAERLDTFGAFYFSPLDMIGFTFLGSLTLSLGVGLNPESITAFMLITLFLAVFQHTNIKTPQWLGYLIQRPESHSVHHSKGIHAYNYSDLPIYDILFGTFRNPKEFSSEIGFYKGASSKWLLMLKGKDILKQ